MKKKAIIITVSVIVAIAVIVAGIFIVMGILNKDANTFQGQLEKLLGHEDLSYSEYQAKVDSITAGDEYTTDYTVSANVTLDELMDQDIQSKINSTKIGVKSSYSKSQGKMYADVAVKNDSATIEADAVVDKEKISVSCKDLYDKYLTVKYDDDTKEEVSNVFDSVGEMSKLFDLTEDQYKALNKNYGNILEDLIDKDNFTTKKNQKVKVGSKDVKTTAYSLTLSGDDTVEFMQKFVDKMKGDDTLKDLIVEKVNLIADSGVAGVYTTKTSAKNATVSTKSSNYYSSNSSSNSTNSSSSDEKISISASDLEDAFDEINSTLDDLKDELKDEDLDKKCIKVTIYSKKSEPVKMEFAVLDDEDDKGTVIYTETLEKGVDTYTIEMEKIRELAGETSDDNYDLSSSSSSNSYSGSSYKSSSSSSASSRKSTSTSSSIVNTVVDKIANQIGSDFATMKKLVVTDEYEEKDETRKGTIKSVAKFDDDDDKELVKIDYEKIDSKSELKFDYIISSDVLSDASSLLNDTSIHFCYDVSNLDKDEKNMNFELGLNVGSYKGSIAITGTQKNSADIPEITDENSEVVDTENETQANTIYNKIIENAEKNLPSKLSSFGLNITASDIEEKFPKTTTDTTAETTDTTAITDGTTTETTDVVTPAA